MNDKQIAFLFPGQGAQYPLMGLDLLETGSVKVRELFELASEIMGRDMAALLGDREALKRGELVQPAITLVNLAAAALLGEGGIYPAACAGHSLGEYAALESAGLISTADCLSLVKHRGAAMRRAAERLTAAELACTAEAAGMAEAASMAAIIGLDPGQVEELTAQWRAEAKKGEAEPAAQAALADIYAANFNSPRQTVVSGSALALALAGERFKAAGARRVIPLPVSGPFHSPLMAGALEEFRPVLEGTVFRDPRIPFYSNVTGGRISSASEAKKLALEQIISPVRWTALEGALADLGLELALETGPGRTLQGLWKDSGSPLPCYGAGTAAEIKGLLEKLKEGLCA
jgi:[acyl-carrier-protein] S-malonyltransferase